MDCPASADYYGIQRCFGYALFDFRSAKRSKKEPHVCNWNDCPYADARDAKIESWKKLERGEIDG